MNTFYLLQTFAIAFALAVDAFAVCLTTACCRPALPRAAALRMAFAFGVFQAGMTIIGWLAGSTFKNAIESFDHWVAFGLLAFVALGMLKEASKPVSCEEDCKDSSRGLELLILAVATSIDALAVGLSFSLLGKAVLFPSLIIGIVAALCSLLGIALGKSIGLKFKLGSKAEIFGALVLLAIGFQILIEHGVFGWL